MSEIKTLPERIIEKAFEIAHKAHMNELIYGDSFIEFGEYSIRLIPNEKIKYDGEKWIEN